MQVSPGFNRAGVLAFIFALAAIAAPIGARADSRRALTFHGSPNDGHATDGSAALFAIPEGCKPTGIAFGSAGGGHAEMDPIPLAKFTIGSIGPVHPDRTLSFAEGMAFDNAGNFYVAHFNTRTIVKFETSGPVLVFAPGEFGPPPAFLAVQVGPIPEPAAIGLLTGVALLGIGAGGRLRRKKNGAALRA